MNLQFWPLAGQFSELANTSWRHDAIRDSQLQEKVILYLGDILESANGVLYCMSTRRAVELVPKIDAAESVTMGENGFRTLR